MMALDGGQLERGDRGHSVSGQQQQQMESGSRQRRETTVEEEVAAETVAPKSGVTMSSCDRDMVTQ